jgi:glutamate 5-kinase
MYLSEKACAERGFHSAQILLTADDVQNRERHLNVRSCLDALLASAVLPVVNENDSVSVDEIRFGDNDVLAALVATLARAELTILLTNVDGLREHRDGGLGRRYSVVESIDDETRAMAMGTRDPDFSVGGMRTKLAAAETVTRAGEHMWIADGTDFAVLQRIFDGNDEGTLFPARKPTRMRGQQRYLAFFSEPRGTITVDEGAARAVREHGRSLLPSGIVGVQGEFHRGDTIDIAAPEGPAFARGIANYSAADTSAIKGRKTSEIGAILGVECYDAAVHRNYMVLIER